MTVTLELRPDLEAVLKATATRAGLSPEQYLMERIEQLRDKSPDEAIEGQQDDTDLSSDLEKLISTFRGTATVIPPTGDLGELLARWRAEDATEDLAELARRDAEWEKLKANLNANRRETGERLRFL
jgi:hypothetical protein